MQFSRVSLMSALAFATVAASAVSASAQSKPYCEGKLVADSFYNTVQSNGTKSDVTYYLQLRNTTNKPVQYSVVFIAQQSRMRANGSWMTMIPNGSNKITLGVDTYNNPSGNGHLDSKYDLPSLTKITCK